MKVLLLDTVEKLGKVGEVVEVKEGYARNFLLPRLLGVKATAGQIKNYQMKVAKLREKLENEAKEAKEVAAKYEGKVISLSKKATAEGKLFGAISQKEIEDLLRQDGLKTDNFSVDLSKVKKKIGEYPFEIDFGHDVKAKGLIKISQA